MIKDYLIILKLRNMFQYRKFYNKWGNDLPFVNKTIYYIYKLFIIILIYILSISTFYILQYILKLNAMSYFYLTFLFIFLLYIAFYYSRIEYNDNQFKFISFIKNRMFSKDEIIRNTYMLIKYDLINIITILIFIFLNYFVLKYRIIKNINCKEVLACINIFLILVYISIEKVTNSYKKYIIGEISKNSFKKYIAYVVLLIIYVFIRFYNLRLIFNYNLLHNLNNIYLASIKYLNSINTYYLNIIILILNLFYFIFFIVLRKNDNDFGKKEIYNEKNIWLHNILNKEHSIKKDFFEKEVKNKLILMIIITIIVFIVQISLLKKTLIISFCLSFLFTQYNQRYLLSDKFLDYMKLFNVDDKIFYSIDKELIKMQLLIAIIFILSIQNIAFISFLYILIGICFFLINIIINTLIYDNGLNLKYSNVEKMNLTEKFSGVFYIVELSLILLL